MCFFGKYLFSQLIIVFKYIYSFILEIAHSILKAYADKSAILIEIDHARAVIIKEPISLISFNF